eukprot:Partr_v1_DN27852_c1_g1_i2_m23046 putative RAM signalling pathway protein domain-containing protein
MGQNLIKEIEMAAQTAETSIDMSKKNLTEIPEEIGRIGLVVERLALSGNYLTQLPNQMANLQKLRYLSIKGNSFTEFPTLLFALRELEILDISKNKLKELPADLDKMPALKVLSIASNKLKTLPSSISNMQELKVLKLDGNPFEPHLKAFISKLQEVVDPNEAISKLKEYVGTNPYHHHRNQRSEDTDASQNAITLSRRTLASDSADWVSRFDQCLRIRQPEVNNTDSTFHGFDVMKEAILTVGFALVRCQQVVDQYFVELDNSAVTAQLTAERVQLILQIRQIVSWIESDRPQKWEQEEIWNLFAVCVVSSRRILTTIRASSVSMFRVIDYRIGKEMTLSLYNVAVNIRDSCELLISFLQRREALILAQMPKQQYPDKMVQILAAVDEAVSSSTMALNSLDRAVKSHSSLKGRPKHELQEIMAATWGLADALARTAHSCRTTRIDQAIFQKLSRDINAFLAKSTKLAHNFRLLSETHPFGRNVLGGMQIFTRAARNLAMAIKK